jgi:hypothetical protein
LRLSIPKSVSEGLKESSIRSKNLSLSSSKSFSPKKLRASSSLFRTGASLSLLDDCCASSEAGACASSETACCASFLYVSFCYIIKQIQNIFSVLIYSYINTRGN